MFLNQLILLSPEAKRFWLRVVATTCCLYPVLDVMGEYIGGAAEGFEVRGETVGSDVSQLSAMIGIEHWLLATAWTVAGFVTVVFLVFWVSRKDAEADVDEESKPRLRKLRAPKPYNPDDPSTIPKYVLK